MSRSQPYTVIVEKSTYELHADTPLRAALSAAATYRTDMLKESDEFVQCCVFVGKTPDCIHNPAGMYCL